MESDRPSLADLAEAILRTAEGRVQVSCTAEVVRYDAATQTADVRPLVSRGRVRRDGSRVYDDAPVVPGVPVAWPSSGGYSMTFPVDPGALVTLVVRDRSHDEVDHGGAAYPVHPGSGRRFSFADAVAFPVDHLPGDPLPADAVASGALILRAPAAGEVRVGSSAASEALALASRVADELTKIQTTLTTLTAPPGGGAVTAGTPYTPGPVGSARILTDD